ncbi:hypothetical protein LSAT2_015003 [Lamellibrachia satsuma]|nr:hypothetical protein LSAT2_015003 [Lamellibrachia satsuma]
MVSLVPVGHFVRDIFQPQEFKRYILDKVLILFCENYPSPLVVSIVDDLVQHVSGRIIHRHAHRPTAASPVSILRRGLHRWQQEGLATQNIRSNISTRSKRRVADAYEYTEARVYKTKVGLDYREMQRKLLALEDVSVEVQDNAGSDLMRPLVPLLASLYIGCSYLFGLAGSVACIFGWSWYASHYLPTRTSAFCQMLDATVTAAYVELYNSEYELADDYLEERIKLGANLVMQRMTIAQLVANDMLLLTDFIAWRNHVWVIGSLAAYTVVLMMHYRRNKPSRRPLSVLQLDFSASKDVGRLLDGHKKQIRADTPPASLSPSPTTSMTSMVTPKF